MRVIREDGASGRFANTWFVNGEAHTDNAGALAYFRRRKATEDTPEADDKE